MEQQAESQMFYGILKVREKYNDKWKGQGLMKEFICLTVYNNYNNNNNNENLCVKGIFQYRGGVLSQEQVLFLDRIYKLSGRKDDYIRLHVCR